MTPPLELIEDAANILAWRGWWEPDDDDATVPEEMAAELAEIAQAPCEVCRAPEGLCRTPDEVADHYLGRRQEEWERSQPVWTCDCGRPFKVIAAGKYYETGDDGLLGEIAGYVKHDSKGRVKHSDACPSCGRKFADTIAGQLNPQQALF